MTELFENINLGRLLLAALPVVLAAWFSRYVTREAERLSERYIRHRHWLMNTSAIVRFLVYSLAAFLAATTLFQFSREALLASAGAIALTFSLAFQDLASSFVAGLTLLIDRPFQVGDRVQFKEFYGDITEIGLRSVRLQTLDDSTISIPNNQFLKDAVSSANAGALDMMVVLDFYLEPNAPFERAKQIVFEAVVTSKFAYLAKPVAVLVNETIVSHVFTTRIMAKAYVFNTKYEKPFVSDVTERVKVAFRHEGIRSMSSAIEPRLTSTVTG